MVLDLLLIGLAITLEPFPLTAFILVLTSQRGTWKGLAFILGWLACLIAVIAAVIVSTGNNPPAPNTVPSDTALVVKLAAGVALILVAVRQLKDWKLSLPIEQMIPSGMKVYARLCGWTLARAHARSGDRIALAAYLGGSDKFDHAIADFAETYADQNERDYAALQAAVKDGRAEASTEI